jgi:hypothetical protein
MSTATSKSISATLVNTEQARVSRSSQRGPQDIYAIFVHAGAGYHSYQNEEAHLQACNEYVTFIELSLAL